ncbi:MAG TPA: DUF3320 domain-containing protein [Methanocorpusculum sp.]|nr:DUF3320 domain-containing protein [Methanocorpusculum sp.]HJK72883.1 DUF3320 domain-containing protein [Methanocorpusculum sp.]
MKTGDTTSELNTLRSRLIDLTLRNNLLNYKPSNTRSIEISGELPAAVYHTLVISEKGMKFYPAGKKADAPAEEKHLWKYPAFAKPTAKQQDVILKTPYDDISLRQRLYSLSNKSRTVFEEQGYPVLYLALGFVSWSEAEHPDKLYKAPLLLIPVELIRQKVKDNYVLRWTGDDPMTSLSLSAKLAEQGVTLPEFVMPETADGLTEYAAAVDAAVRAKGWEYCPDIALDLFSFRKFVMFKDLDPESWDENFSPETHPLIAELFHPGTTSVSRAGDTFPENEIDIRLPSEKSYNIMDADSSQVAVIEEAKSGKNLVVEGPPGTGKSQTIANMIAEMLVSGKTVLFVSEKMAALEVVKRRLDTAGLSRFCLELHSQKAKKGEVIRELERCIQHPGSSAAPQDSIHLQIDSLRDELDGYCRELADPIGECAFTPYDLFGIREQYRYEFEDSPDGPNCRIPRVVIPAAKDITPDQYKDAIAALHDIEALLPSLMPTGRPLSQHPWAGCAPGLVLPQDRDEILELVENYRSAIEQLLSAMRQLSDLTGVSVPREETGVSLMVESCRLLTSEFAADAGVLTNPLWDKPAEVNRLIAAMRKLSDHRTRILASFTPEVLLSNPSQLYSAFREVSGKGKIAKIFSSAYKEIKAQVSSYYRGAVPPDSQILTDLLDARDYLTELDVWERDRPVYATAFAPVWKGEETDPAALTRYAEWISAVRLMIKEGPATQRTLELLDSGSITAAAVSPLFAEVESSVIAHSDARTKLFARLGISETDDSTFAEQRKRCDLWSSDVDGVVLWSKFLTYTDALGETVAAPLLELLFADKLEPGELVPAFLTGYADSLLREAMNERPLLARFSQIPHEQKIAAFAACDRDAISENCKRIIKILDEKIPELYTGASRDSEMGVLTGEFNRKRGHMSIRMLMSKAGGLVQQIKPCFMMSPLSVAQYLDPRSVQFDVIIFDEASQVRPEDALGALMRGRQLVVMGDSRQLPPTTFFDQIASSDDEDEVESVASITDMESLLNVCKQSYETKRLRWHYRSRHESLIAVSNQEFYDGNLMIFPSPMHETPDLGLSFVHLPDTVYERGKAGVNRGEARVVAEAVIDYYRRFPDKTLGVATFSTRQQEVIRHEVELLLRENPDVESLMRPENGENFFVKNLETVQGDERDTMLISIGYGFDENHKLSRNFGPLNQDGGERRLNVLITRARERCVVFANFRGSDLAVEPGSASGISALATFLTYAADRSTPLDASGEAPDDVAGLFGNTVARLLEDNGYHVAQNVGCAGFRIDIAIEDPNEPGVYLAGILCDGPYYWSSEVARDRDRLRVQVLEGLGWNLIRIWATEWYQHPASCTKTLLDAVEAAKSAPKKKPAPKVVSPVKTAEKKSSAKKTEEEPEASAPPAPSAAPVSLCLVPYTCCSECSLDSYHQFSSVPDSVLGTAIVQIVAVEGPISKPVLAARVKELGHVPRMTAAVKGRIAAVAAAEVSEGRLSADEEGFLTVPESIISPRERPAKWSAADVSLAEISAAAVSVLEKQFSTPRDDLIRQTAVVLGFKATAAVKERIASGIDAGIADGRILLEGNICKAA